jgi:hypothetical protein
MSESTKKYVVVFDELHKATGELTPGSPGSPPLQVVSVHHRGDTVELDDETAKRHLEVGAILPAGDKRAKLIQPNEQTQGGVKREAQLGVVELEQHDAAQPGADGAKRTVETADYANMNVTSLKKAAKAAGVDIDAKDRKPQLVKKMQAWAKTQATEPEGDLRPGQGKDESPPPEHQPGDEPE